ncbi:Mitochondral 37S ribosomal protein S27 [Wickerhamomyces ciferrii]|uniref:Small ribosomal subunit protein mS33 n=1 Tax=Wickerhamomyces ciferrii (strain ATCC 14091 / BCRC 22168 / CBS 111 / JCM 3599 / NBRC 0793 / NRRL Y-1031 F-60-10) TaxID=1206466 RepID=K0KGZ2_WICCF|nr:Mitochondral 37S ribosomal protein S27 [Wickerhamomyces ciferrii]CCH41452.1 Mitochondral 37S ribosomal protein S27 [Wickerhamomyces ciferrii]
MSLIPNKARLLELVKLRCKVFNENYNPTNIRTGSKILSSKLKGPTVKDYYGNPEILSLRQVQGLHPEMKFADPAEVYRLKIHASYVLLYFDYLKFKILTFPPRRKRRGKGAPKKKREPPSAHGKKK